MILLVDGNALVCRLWWAAPHGVVGRFERIVQRFEAEDVRIAWDAGRSWRADVYPGYKAGRPSRPTELGAAILACRRLGHPGWEHALAEGYEADDILATWTESIRATGGEVLILSPDKDLCQLVRPGVSIVSSKGEIVDYEGVVSRLGVPPNLVRHLLSWTGDAADGLPGVPGYGPKRGAIRALAGEIGNRLTYDLTELVEVPGLRASAAARSACQATGS